MLRQGHKWNLRGLARCYFLIQVLQTGILIVCNVPSCTFKIILFLRFVTCQRNVCLKNILSASTHTSNKQTLSPRCNLKIHYHTLRNAAPSQSNDDNRTRNRLTEGSYLLEDHFPEAESVTFSYTFRGPQGLPRSQHLSLCIKRDYFLACFYQTHFLEGRN